MQTQPRLKVKLFEGWRPVENPRTLATYVRGDTSNSGSLQFSLAQYQRGILSSVTEDTLLGLCQKLAGSVRGRRDVSSGSGKCEFGLFGTVTAKGDSPAHFQVWVISNGREFILITHTCAKEPDPQEVAEANEIALMTGLTRLE